jgi:hypothetical protein
MSLWWTGWTSSWGRGLLNLPGEQCGTVELASDERGRRDVLVGSAGQSVSFRPSPY